MANVTFTKVIGGETYQAIVSKHNGVGANPKPFKTTTFFVHREASAKNQAGFAVVAHTATSKLAKLNSAFANEIKNADVGL